MEELLTVREVARRLRVDVTTVRRWIKNGAWEAVTLPHQGKRHIYRIRKSTLDALLSGQKVGVLRLAEEVYGLPALTQRDANAGDLLAALDFSKQWNPPMVLQ